MIKNKVKFSVIVLALTIFIAGGIYLAFYEGFLRFNYPSFDNYPIHGLDISHHQHQIDWSKLDKKYTRFIYMKATEGADHKDTRFEEYAREAIQLNIPIGAYHFFTLCKSGKEQADNFIESVPIGLCSLPPAIDLEFDGNCQPANHKEDLQSEITEFINIIEEYYQTKVLIYATPEFYNKYIANHFSENPIWARNIYSEPILENNRKWIFWQYANKGRLEGIDTHVDINVFYGNETEFSKMINSN